MQRINKRQARKLFAENKTLWLQSSNMPFNSMWQSAFKITPLEYWQHIRTITDYGSAWEEFKKRYDDLATYTDEEKMRAFESMCNNFAFYNCDHERGYYIHFYCEDQDFRPIVTR